METLITSAFRAVRSLFTPGMFSVFFLSIALTIAALLGFVGMATSFFTWLAHHMQDHALASFLPWLGSIGSGLIAWFLFPGIMPIIINFFDDRIARLIERHDYPAAPTAKEPAFWPELRHDIRFSILMILLNILVLPLYLIPIINVMLFYGLNGYLLGREFFVMAARRHITIIDAEIMRKRYSKRITMAGIGLALLATIPIINLFAPFWGIAVMVHLYHRLQNIPTSELLYAK